MTGVLREVVRRCLGSIHRMSETQTAIALIRAGAFAEVLDGDWSPRVWPEIGAVLQEMGGSSAEFAQLAVGLLATLPHDDPSVEYWSVDVLCVKAYVHRLPSSDGDVLLAWLETRVGSDSDRGYYDQLDYPYGQVLPIVELALCYAKVGRTVDAARWLHKRAGLAVGLLNAEELSDLAEINACWSDEQRANWWPVMREWARRASASEGESPELGWLIRACPPNDVSAEIDRLVADGPGPEALTDLLRGVGGRWVTPEHRAHARLRMIEWLRVAVDGASAVDTTRHRWIRAVRCAAEALNTSFDELTPRQRAQVAKLAGVWARWFAGLETQHDWSPHVSTTLAFVGRYPDEVAPAVARIRGFDIALLGNTPGLGRILESG